MNKTDTLQDEYSKALKRIDNLTPFVDLASEMQELAREGRINDMRRRLVIAFAELATPTPQPAVGDEELRKEVEALRVRLLGLHGIQQHKLGGVLLDCQDCHEFEKRMLKLLDMATTQATERAKVEGRVRENQASVYVLANLQGQMLGIGAPVDATLAIQEAIDTLKKRSPQLRTLTTLDKEPKK